MIVLAVLLLLLVALVVLFVVVTGTTGPVQLEWAQISTTVSLTPLAIFLLGAVSLLLAELALTLLLRGNRKNAERRKELKHLRRVEAERARHADAPAGTTTDRTDTGTRTATGHGAVPEADGRTGTDGRAGSTRS